MAVKIAEGFVEVTAKTDTAKTRKSAEKAGRESGGWFARAFGRSSEKTLGGEERRLTGVFKRMGTKAGAGFMGAVAKSFVVGRRTTDTAAHEAGKSAGEEFGDGFKVGADGRLRGAKGRFVAGLGTGFDKAGKRAGSGFMGGLGGSVSRGMGGIVSTVSGGFSQMGRHPWLLVGVVAAAMAALPMIGAAAATGLVLAFGAGIAGIGILAAAQADQVKTAFTDLKDHVVARMREIAAPLQGTLVSIAGHAQGLFDALAPHLEQAFADMAPVLDQFSADLAEAFKGDGSLIEGATGAFNALLTDLGPKLGPVFEDMGDALKDLFATIEENPEMFSAFITGALQAVTGLIRFVGWLSKVHVWIAEKIPAAITTLMAPFQSFRDDMSSTSGEGESLVDKLKKMGDAFKEAWDSIKQGAQELWDAVQPVLQDLKDALLDSDVFETLSGWWDDLSEIVSLVGEFIGTEFKRIAGVVKGVWDTIGPDILGVLSGLWTGIKGIISGIFETVKGIFNTFIGVFTGDWSRAWEGIKQIFSGLWTAVVGIFQGAWQILKSVVMGAVNGVVGLFKWLWNMLVGNSIIPDMVNAIIDWFTGLRDKAVGLWNQIKDWIVGKAKALYEMVRVQIILLYNRAMSIFNNLRAGARMVWETIRSWVVDKATALKDKVVSAFNTLKDKAISAFTKAKDGIKEVWDKLKKAAKDPVSFVVDTVYNDGIRAFWNNIAGKIGMGKLPKIEGFERGGLVDMRRGGVQPGYSSKDNRIAAFRDGEGVLVPEAVQALGPSFVHAANRLKHRAGDLLLKQMPGFQRGGIVGAVNDFFDKSKDFFSGGFMNAVRAVTDPIVATMRSEFGTTGFKGLPTKAVQHVVDKLHGFLSPFESTMSGGSGQKVVEVAEKYVGTSGNPNQWTRRMGMNGLPWCGMFVDGVFEEAGASRALRSVWNPAAVRSYRVLPKVSRSEARPGDLPLYRSDDGHINIFTGEGTVTIGGNESNSVKRQSGYMLSASSIRRPAFAGGGIVGAFIGQDERENSELTTPLKTRLLREVMAGTPWAHGTHDGGGILLDGQAGVNRSGQAEVVATLEQLKALVAAGRGATYIFEEGAITLDASKLQSIADIIRLIEGLQQEARRHGSRTRVGAPR